MTRRSPRPGRRRSGRQRTPGTFVIVDFAPAAESMTEPERPVPTTDALAAALAAQETDAPPRD